MSTNRALKRELSARKFGQGFSYLRFGEGFVNDVIDSRGICRFIVLCLVLGGYHDDGQFSVTLPLSDPFGEIDAGDIGHVQIGKDHVRFILPDLL